MLVRCELDGHQVVRIEKVGQRVRPAELLRRIRGTP